MNLLSFENLIGKYFHFSVEGWESLARQKPEVKRSEEERKEILMKVNHIQCVCELSWERNWIFCVKI